MSTDPVLDAVTDETPVPPPSQPDLATMADIQAGWRPLTADEQTRAPALISKASRLIYARDPHVQDQIAAGRIASATVSDIVAAMVHRALSSAANAQPAAAQMQETAGPFSMGYTPVSPGDDLYLTASERKTLGIGGMTGGSVDLTNPTAWGI